jgi:hypothetical protein
MALWRRKAASAASKQNRRGGAQLFNVGLAVKAEGMHAENQSWRRRKLPERKISPAKAAAAGDSIRRRKTKRNVKEAAYLALKMAYVSGGSSANLS